MSVVKFSTTILVIIALLSPCLVAGGFENTAVGIQAKGLAGAFRAIADDWTAAYYNPAGYALVQDNQLGGSVGLVHLRNELNPTYRLDGIYETGILNDQINYNKHEVYSNPAGGLVARLPVMGETVIGLSAYQPFDYNIAWRLYELPLTYNDSLTLPKDQFSNNLDVVAFQVTFARELQEEKLSVGLGFQVLRADLRYTSIVFRDNPYDGTPLDVRPYDQITEWNVNDGRGWGFGLTGGAMLKLTEKLDLGLTARLPFDITIDGTTRLEFFMPSISSLLTPGSNAGVEYLPGTPEYLFASGSRIVDTADFETKLKLPPSVGFGLAYAVNDDLTLTFDGEMTLWSRFEGFDFVFTNHRGLTGAADTSALVNDFLTADLSYPADWNDTRKWMLGFRYNLEDLFTFVGGGSFDESPVSNTEKIAPQFIETGDSYTISGGIIYHRDRWDFGLAGSYTSYPDLTVSGLVDDDSDGLVDNIPGDYKASTYETVLSFNYRF